MSQPPDYPLFAHWYKTLDWILDRCERMPKTVRLTISDRIATHSIDIAEMITEAIYTKDRHLVLKGINLRLEKLRILFRLCQERRYLSVKQYAFISEQINEAGKMVGGWLKS